MNLRMNPALATGYKSASQQARIITEEWAQRNLYCANCDSDALIPMPNNARAIDFTCDSCAAPFQLKSQKKPFGDRIVDSGYEAMCNSIRTGHTPNLFVVEYQPVHWQVLNVLLVPAYGFSLACVEKRKPLSKSAKRAGWVGCNILLSNIPFDLRIPLVKDGIVANKSEARNRYSALANIQSLRAPERGWLLDVWNAAQSLNKAQFTLDELYKNEARLKRLHPENYNIRAKIRQQLQILRDMGLLQFMGRGNYVWREWHTSPYDRS